MLVMQTQFCPLLTFCSTLQRFELYGHFGGLNGRNAAKMALNECTAEDDPPVSPPVSGTLLTLFSGTFLTLLDVFFSVFPQFYAWFFSLMDCVQIIVPPPSYTSTQTPRHFPPQRFCGVSKQWYAPLLRQSAIQDSSRLDSKHSGSRVAVTDWPEDLSDRMFFFFQSEKWPASSQGR